MNTMKQSALIAGLLALFVLPAMAAEPANAPAKGGVAARAEQLLLDDVNPASPEMHVQRLKQDEAMRLCSQTRDNPPPAVRKQIESASRTTIHYPVSGMLMGDWKKGEALASSGRGGHIGFIQADKADLPRGGNCYACHQLAKKEVAYGTIGPSLQQFGKLRGYSKDMQKYAYEKIYNAQSFTACTNMPRFGFHHWLTPEEIAHVVAFLMDPESPVNAD